MRGFPEPPRIGYTMGMIRTLILLAALCPFAALCPNSASAQQPTRTDVAAQQAASLFVASCVAYAGDPAGLRAWAGKIGLPALPDPGQAGFLKGAAGKVFDASNPAGKYVVISHDEGGCFILAEAVNTAELVRAAEAALATAAINAVLDGDRADLGDTGMRHRNYHAALGQRSWTMVISYGPGQPDQAMLSAVAR